MPSPLPPPSPDAVPEAGTRVTPIMFGQPWTGPDGTSNIASVDGVLLELTSGQIPVAALFVNAEVAIDIALRLQSAAVTTINKAVDDTGAKLSITERFDRYNKAFKTGGTK